MNSASGSRLQVRDSVLACEVRASNEFDLDNQRVVLIDTPGFNDMLEGGYEKVIRDIKKFLAESYVKTSLRDCSSP